MLKNYTILMSPPSKRVLWSFSGNSAASQRLHLKISMAATTYQRPGRSCDSLKSTGESHELAAAETSLSLVQ